MSTPSTTFTSNFGVELDIPEGVEDEDIRLALFDIHNTIRSILIGSLDKDRTIISIDSSTVTAYTVSKTEGIIVVDASTASVVLTLPKLSTNFGHRYIVKRTDNVGGNTVTVIGDSSEPINGSGAGDTVAVLSKKEYVADRDWETTYVICSLNYVSMPKVRR